MESLKEIEIQKFINYFKQKYSVVLYSNIFLVDIINGLKQYFLQHGKNPKNYDFEKLANEVINYLKLQNTIKYVEKNTYNVINNF